jgi:hypothetical protein
MHQQVLAQSRSASGSSFWRDEALPFIESRSVEMAAASVMRGTATKPSPSG